MSVLQRIWAMNVKLLALPLLASGLVLGCGTSHTVLGPTADVTLAEAAEDLVNEEVTIYAAGLPQDEGIIEGLTPDTLLYRSTVTHRPVSIPVSSLQRIESAPPALQVVGGSVVGGIGGFAVGMGIATVATSHADGLGAMGIALVTVAGFTVAGVMVGGIVGSDGTSYNFVPAAADYDVVAGPVRPVHPPE
jgi:hypothetical protein